NHRIVDMRKQHPKIEVMRIIRSKIRRVRKTFLLHALPISGGDYARASALQLGIQTAGSA
ncbi:hypothetical protein SE17_09330, partial [Kouleothrix aurantiaca]